MKIMGIVLIMIGILVGLYMGVWVMFVGGIVQIVEQLRAEHLIVSKLAWGVIRVVLSGFVGWLSALCFIVPGYTMTQD
jgi:hypothetical protein